MISTSGSYPNLLKTHPFNFAFCLFKVLSLNLTKYCREKISIFAKLFRPEVHVSINAVSGGREISGII
jgi:hypothetical protein